MVSVLFVISPVSKGKIFMGKKNSFPNVLIVGVGFGGLAAGYELTRQGYSVTILEKYNEISGLASCFLCIPSGNLRTRPSSARNYCFQGR
ncbi:hypothetical protein ES703_92659 [subsurface metagenome]